MSGRRWDLVVAGGGGCGLTAAVRAAQLGASVLVLEKDEALGGNTTRSISSVPGAGTRFQAAAGIDDSPRRFVDDLARQAGDHLDRAVARRLCALSAELVHWLVDEAGVPLRLTEDYRHIAHSVNRLHNPPSREGAELVEALATAARTRGVAVETGARVTDVEVVEPEGVRVHTASGETVQARTVLLATDGFGADRDRVREHTPRAAGLPYFGGRVNTGDGMAIGQRLGGRIAAANALLGYAAMAVPRGGEPSFETMFSWTVIEKGGVLVDTVGRRFGDESVGYSAFTDDVVRSTDGTAFAVFDTRIRDTVAAHEGRFARLVARRDSPVLSAGTASELAELAGLDPVVLTRTVERYDAAALGREVDEYGRTDVGLAPLHAPLVITRTVPGFLTTQGGLVVDDDARVMAGDRPVPGVHAGGGTASGIGGPSGFRGYVSGNGLLAALGYGYLAGTEAGRGGRATRL